MRRLAAAALLAGLALAGCSEDDAPADPAGEPSAGGSRQTQEEPEGPAPEALSAEVLAAADGSLEAPALGSGTAAFGGGAPVTVDVLAVDRLPDATLVRLRLTSPAPTSLGVVGFRSPSRGYSGVDFANTLALEDPQVSGQRYLPLQFEDYRDACACPAFPIRTGPAPQVTTAVFPALPDGVETVTLRVGETGVVVDGLPVADAG